MFLKKGQCYCGHCHTRFSTQQALYTGAGLSTTPLLFRMEDNRPVLMEQFAKQYTVSGKGRRANTDGFIEFDVLDSNQKRTTIVAGPETRVCPHCKKPIHGLMGTADSYLIGLVGNTYAGKTSLSQAVLSDQVMTELGRILDCDIRAYTHKNRVKSDATNPGTFDIGFCFQLRKNGRLINILIADVAGETFRTDRNLSMSPFSLRYAHILDSCCDGVLLLFDERDTVFGDPDDAKSMYNISSFLSRVRKKPVACVLNKSDRLRALMEEYQMEAVEHQGVPVTTKNSPLFTEFDHRDPTGEMACHMAGASDLFRYFVHTGTVNHDHMPCFVVSCGKTMDDEIIDLSYQKNILLPILYLLRQFIL